MGRELKYAYGVLFVLLIGVLWCIPGAALAIPSDHAYEMVSPSYKGGYGIAHIEAAAANGDSVAFFSKGAFAGAPGAPSFMDYVARRGGAEWLTTPIMPPTALMPDFVSEDVSPSLGLAVAFGKPGRNEEAAFHEGIEDEFLAYNTESSDTDGSWRAWGTPFGAINRESFTGVYLTGSTDLCRLFLGQVEQPLVSEAIAAKSQSNLLYEFDTGCGGRQSQVKLVGLNNSDETISRSCEINLGISTQYGSKQSLFNAVTSDGEEVFFTTSVENNVCVRDHQLFVRLGGARTLEVSKPLFTECTEVPCLGATSRSSAEFVGASRDGSKVFFATTEEELSGTPSGTANLYMATIGCPVGEAECDVTDREVTSLALISRGIDPGESGEMQGTVRLAPDALRVYFVARGVLSTERNTEGQVPIRGADNLYVYDSASGKTIFITDLCSGPGISGPGGSTHAGAVEDVRCPLEVEKGASPGYDAGLWASSTGEAQTAGQSGEFLVFTSYGKLTSDDTDTAKDVYRYDVSTGVLVRVSVGEAGDDANGNNDQFGATIEPGLWGGRLTLQYELGNRTVNENGSRLIFQSAEPLSPGAVNGLANVYEWSEAENNNSGHISLVSGGSAAEPVVDSVISAEGNDVFFITTQALVSRDVDIAPDIYDARLNGGFPISAAPRQPCSGDACQGPLTNPSPLLIPGSVSQAPGENIAPVIKVKSAKPKKKARKPVKRGKNKGKARRAGSKRNPIVAGKRP
jgi:hypothetical protein